VVGKISALRQLSEDVLLYLFLAMNSGLSLARVKYGWVAKNCSVWRLVAGWTAGLIVRWLKPDGLGLVQVDLLDQDWRPGYGK
jgi:hypothetical protein